MINKTLVLLICCSLIASCNFSKDCQLNENTYYKVVKILDDDTFAIDDRCDGIRIRLTGINAPESQNRWELMEEPFGREAKKYMTNLVLNKKVRLEFDVDTFDRYNRVLAYCYLDNGQFINQQIVLDGFAQIDTHPPNVKYEKAFYQSQIKARKYNKGMWQEL